MHRACSLAGCVLATSLALVRRRQASRLRLAAASARRFFSGTTVARADRLAAMRALMAEHNLGAYLVYSGDAHSSEYVADRDQRRAWISGFTGSAGTAVVLRDDARLWTDGRYFLQAEAELLDGWQLMRDGEDGTPTIEDFLADALRATPGAAVVGVDAELISLASARRVEKALGAAGLEMRAVAGNLVDVLWGDAQPAAPVAPVRVHALADAGMAAEAKLDQLRGKLGKAGATAALVTALDEISWLLNIRGGDIAFNPVVQAYLLVPAEPAAAVQLFLDDVKLAGSSAADGDAGAASHLDRINVRVKSYSTQAVADAFASLVASSPGKVSVTMDPATCNFALHSALLAAGGEAVEQASAVAAAKAIKNATEQEGFRAAHVRDGAAVVRFLAWLEGQLSGDVDVDDGLTEVSAAEELERLRRDMSPSRFVQPSFDTISGVGSNGAIIHYKPEPETCARMRREAMYLVDSGAQYTDGTTDITRTVHHGTPTAHQIRCFTRVLQGHIDLACAVFPNGTTGYRLDLLARAALWQDGLDFRHGTGHGVGSYLNVHEGPHGISSHVKSDAVALKAGMTVTNEPGYYETGRPEAPAMAGGNKGKAEDESESESTKFSTSEMQKFINATRAKVESGRGAEKLDTAALRAAQEADKDKTSQWHKKNAAKAHEANAEAAEAGEPGFGIRHENIMIVQPAQTPHDFGAKGYLRMETVTVAPFQRKCIDVALLSVEQRTWLDVYHARVRQTLEPLLEQVGDEAAVAYLRRETAPLGGTGTA